MGAHLSAGSKRTRFLAALTGAGAIGLITTAAWAVIPDASGTVHGCYAPDGVLQVVDSEAGQRCKKNEKALNWDTTPTPELPDAFVALGTDEVRVPHAHTVLASLALQPGKYEVSAKVFLGSTSDQSFPGSALSCQLTPSNPDGTPGDPGGPPGDAGALLLAAPFEPGSVGTLTLGVSQVLAQPGSVVLDCIS